MKPTSAQSDLLLLALRYAAGELSGAESAGFEKQLAADLDAQEALARAVRLASALGTRPPVGPVVVRPVRRRPVTTGRRRSAWLAVLSSSAVAAAVLAALWEEPGPTALTDDTTANAGVGVMVADWVDVDLEDGDLLSADDADLLLPEDEPSIEDAGEIVPDWLLAAVEISSVSPDLDDVDASSGDGLDEIDEET